MVGEPLDRELAGDVLREQTENLRMVVLAHHVHLMFHVRLDGVERLAQLG